MQPLILTVIPHPTTKTGYTLQHNRHIGWHGCKQDHIGWFRTRRECEARKTLLMNWHNMFYTESILESGEKEYENSGDLVLF